MKEDFTYIVVIMCVDYYVDDPILAKENFFTVNVTFSHQKTSSGNVLVAGTPATNVMTKPVSNYSTASSFVPSTLATANINEHSHFFDNIWNLVAVTTAGSILMIVICSCLALIGYRIRKKRKRMARVVQVREM